MTANIQDRVMETVDYIYQRLRTQISGIGSSSSSEKNLFFVFGASVCFFTDLISR
jgi:hypothetical protein